MNPLSNILLCFIFGTRPEVIKLWPVIHEAKSRGIKTLVISTGQQQELLRDTLADLFISPDIDLNLMQLNTTLESFLTLAISELSVSLNNCKPSLVVVQGDTSSALAGALASYLLKIPIGHVEAGLRSGDLYSPWPEEGNRRLIDSLANFLWIPTKKSIIAPNNDQKINVVGNTVVDALRMILKNNFRSIELDSKSYVLVTLHRRESFGEPMVSSMQEIIKFSNQIEHEVIFIQHPNPNVNWAMNESGMFGSRIRIMQPVPYSKFVEILRGASLLITDSGGLQEEATTLGVPLIIARDKTERMEAVSITQAELVGSHGENLIAVSEDFLNKKFSGDAKKLNDKFGDGYAAKRIIDDVILEMINR